MIRHAKRATRHLLFWSLLIIAIGLSGVRLLLSGIADYKQELAGQVSTMLGASVSIGRLNAKIRGFSPELILKDINIASVVAGETPAIALKEIRVHVDLLALAYSREWLSTLRMSLVGAKLSVIRKRDGSFAVVGLKAGEGQPLWLFKGSKFELLQSEITWQDELRQTPPVTFAPVNLAITNRSDYHQIKMLAKLPENYGKAFTAVAELQGDPFQAAGLEGQLYFAGKNIEPTNPLLVELSPDIKLTGGSADLALWAKLKQSQIVAVKSQLALQHLKLEGKNQNAAVVNALTGVVNWHLIDKQANFRRWRLDAKLSAPTTLASKVAVKWPAATISVVAQFNNENTLQNIGLVARQVDLQQTSPVIQFIGPLPQDVRHLLSKAQAKGSLAKLALFADTMANQAALSSVFNNISIAPVNNLPGLTNFSGQIIGTGQQGKLQLTTQHASIIADQVMAQPLPIDNLNATIKWRQNQDNWLLSGKNLALALPGLQSNSQMQLMVPKSGAAPFLDFQSVFSSADVTHIKNYYPVKLMKQADVAWLSKAFVRGRIETGKLRYFSKLDLFPKQGREGIFEAVFEARDVELDYAPDWPHMTGISGTTMFLRDRMEIHVKQGLSHNLTATNAVVINEAVGKSKKLLIKGEVNGKIADALQFLTQSPLNDRIGNLAEAVIPVGDTKVNLDIVLPITAGGGEPKLDGKASLDHAGLNIKAIDLWVNKISGSLKFNEHGIYCDPIQATALGQPVRITASHADSTTLIKANGQAAVDDIVRQFKLPDWQFIHGSMPYSLTLKLPYGQGRTELSVNSDLVGVEVALPATLAKKLLEPRQLQLDFDLSEDNSLPITINYADKLKATLNFNADGQSISSGHLLVGEGKNMPVKESGLGLEINQDTLDLKQWLNWFGALGKNQGQGIAIRGIAVHSPQAYWGKTPLGVFGLNLKPNGADWSGIIDSGMAIGKIHIPTDLAGKNAISLKMDMLDLSALKNLQPADGPGAQVSAPTPTSLPLVNISSVKTLWQNMDLGFLVVGTSRLPDGIAFTKLELNGLAQKLTATGDWKTGLTRIKGQLTMPNAGQLLSRLGITHDLVRTEASADFALQWSGAPHQLSLSKLQGDVDLNFTGGRILSIEPGFGRILGIVAMAQWGKRLQLDFSDLYEEGLTFDTIKGHFDIRNGAAYTSNLVVDAIPALINISGTTDFVSKTIDEHVTVKPKGAEAVPIAGTIMNKVTNLIARTLTGENQEGFLLGSEYQIKGGWDAMQIIPLHENDGLLQKTWTGITDFPWLPQPEK